MNVSYSNRSMFAVAVALAMGASWAMAQVNEKPPAENYEDLMARSMRWPIMGIPQVAKAPVVDGKLDEAEWSGAAWFPDCLYDSETSPSRAGLPARDRLDVMMEYTPDAVYLGYRMHMPHGVKPVAGGIPEKRDSHKGYGNDVVNFFLNPDGGKWTLRGQRYHIIGNALGVMSDRHCTPEGMLWAWDWTNAVHKARLIEDGYEGEFYLPLKEVQAENPKPGALWRANFLDGRVGIIAGWCYYNLWNPYRVGLDIEDGWLVMTGKPLAARFVHGGNRAKLQPVTVEVNGEFPAGGVDAEFQLYRRNTVPVPKEPGSLAILGKLVRMRRENGSATWGNSYQSILDMVMKDLKPLGEPVRKNLKKGDNRIVAPKVSEEGEYVLFYKVTQGKNDLGGVLAAGALPFRVEPDLAMTIKPLVLTRGKIVVETDMMNLPHREQAKDVHVVATNAEGKRAGSASVPAGNGGGVEADLPVKDWPLGTYQVVSEVVGTDGKVMASTRRTFERVADPDWWTTKAGMTPAVPPPFLPVKVQPLAGEKKGATVEVIRRKYTFDGSGVPSSIMSQANGISLAEPEAAPVEILSSPIEFKAVVGGREVKWSCATFKVAEQKETHVTFETVNEGEGLVLSTETKVEFDGMVFVKFKLASKDSGQPATLDSLDLVLPFRPAVAQLMHNFRPAPGPGLAVLDKSASKGVRYTDRIPAETRKDVPFYEQFIGNGRVGLEWTCERTKGWRMKRAQEANEVRPEKDRVLEIFHMVDYPVKLDQPVEIEFGLMAAPVKPMPKNWGLWRYDEQCYLPPIPGLSGKGTSSNRPVPTQEDLDAWKRKVRYTRVNLNGNFMPWWTGVEWNMVPITDPELVKTRKAQFEVCHELGQKVFMHGGWYCIVQGLPEFKNWGYEMIKGPSEGSFNNSLITQYNSPYTDWLVHNIEYNARAVGNDGIRWDTVNIPVECYSPLLDNAWKDENGREWPTIRIWAAREMFKRNYRIFHGGVKQDGFSLVANAGPPILAQCSFADMYHVGEGFFEAERTMRKGYPPMTVRVLMGGGNAYGFPVQNNLKGAMSSLKRSAALLVAGAEPRYGGSGILSYRGYQMTPTHLGGVVEIWNAYEWIDRGNSALFRPYWENSEFLKLDLPPTSSGKPAEVYASFYCQPGKKVLLVATSYEEETLEKVGVKLDLAKLGFKPGEPLYAEDAVTFEPLELKDGEVRLGFFQERFRVVKISRETPRFHASRLGSNLMADGGMDQLPKDGAAISPPIKEGEAGWLQADPAVKHGGGASLRFTKTTPSVSDRQVLSLAPVKVGKGDHVLSGWVRIDRSLGAPLERENPRQDYACLNVSVNGVEVALDRPPECVYGGGNFIIGEKTPGWIFFSMPFAATEKTGQVQVQAVLTGLGSVWLDDLEIRELRAK